MKTNFKIKRILSKVLAFTMFASLFTSAASVSAATYSYTPSLNDTYDDGTAALDLRADYCDPVTYTDEDNRGKVVNVPFVSKASTTEINISRNISEYISGDKYYISFDINTDGSQNISIMPCNSDTSDWKFPLSLMVGKNGFVIFQDSVPPVNNAYAGSMYATMFGANGATLRNWGFKTAYDVSANTWYNIKFLYDKTASKIYGIVNNQIVHSIDVKNWTDITRLLVRNYTDNQAGNIKFDNFQIGTYEQFLTVENCTFKNGTAVIEFSDDIDQTSLTKDTIKITDQNGNTVDYTGTYADKKYTCVINNYNSLLEYKITAEGYKNSSNVTGIKFEKTFDGDDYIYTTKLDDNYDEQTKTYDWKMEWCDATSFSAVDGRGYVLTVPTTSKPATTETNISFGDLSKYMTSDNANYASFDIKFDEKRDVAFGFHNNYMYPAPIVISKNGFISTQEKLTTVNQYTGNTKTVMNYSSASDAINNGRAAMDFNATEWNNIKFIFDKRNNIQKVYVNEQLLASVDVGSNYADVVSSINSFLLRDCGTTKTNIYIDNFEIGTAEETSLKLVNASGEEVTEFSANDTVYASVITKNNTAVDEVRVVAIASYDETNTMIDIKSLDLTTKAGKFSICDVSNNISVSANGAKTIKAYLWSGWNTLKPLCQSVCATLKQTTEQ